MRTLSHFTSSRTSLYFRTNTISYRVIAATRSSRKQVNMKMCFSPSFLQSEQCEGDLTSGFSKIVRFAQRTFSGVSTGEKWGTHPIYFSQRPVFGFVQILWEVGETLGGVLRVVT